VSVDVVNGLLRLYGSNVALAGTTSGRPRDNAPATQSAPTQSSSGRGPAFQLSGALAPPNALSSANSTASPSSASRTAQPWGAFLDITA
jgi:hypothetical protein